MTINYKSEIKFPEKPSMNRAMPLGHYISGDITSSSVNLNKPSIHMRTRRVSNLTSFLSFSCIVSATKGSSQSSQIGKHKLKLEKVRARQSQPWNAFESEHQNQKNYLKFQTLWLFNKFKTSHQNTRVYEKKKRSRKKKLC